MRNSKYLIVLAFLIFIPIVSAADVTTVEPGTLSEVNLTFLDGGVLSGTISTTPDATSCAGDWNTTYTCANTYDGDWDTYGYAADMDGDVYVYHNYTIPSLAGDNVTWEIKYDSPAITVNYTVPSSCLTASTLEFRYFGLWSAGSGNSYGTYACKNSSDDWETIYDGNSNSESGDFYEGQVHWDRQNYFFQIPNTEVVNSATLNVTGYPLPNGVIENSSAPTHSVDCVNPANAYDELWSTYSSGGGYCWVNETFAGIDTSMTYKFKHARGSSAMWIWFWNYSSSSFDQVYYETGLYCWNTGCNDTLNLSSDYISGGEVKVQLKYNTATRFFEGAIEKYTEPTNASIQINGSEIWNYTGELNTSETTSDFASFLNSELSSCSTSTCNISLDIFSDSTGILELSEFDIEYNEAPYSTANYPTDGATEIPYNVTLNASVFDVNGDTLNGTLYLILDEETSSSWVDQGCSEGSDSEANAVDEDWDTYAAGGTIYENVSLDENLTAPYWKYKVNVNGPSPIVIECYNSSEWITMDSTLSSGTFTTPINATCYDQEILQLRINTTLTGIYCDGGFGSGYSQHYYEGQLVRNSSYTGLSNGSIVNETYILKGPRTYLWYLNLTDGFESNYSIWDFTVESVPLDNGTVYDNELITFFLKDEETKEVINGSIAVVVFTAGTNYTFSGDDISNLTIYGPEGSVSITEAFIQYSSTGYSVENYYLTDDEWSTDSPLTVNLYDINDSKDTVFEISVLDSSLSGLDGAYVKLLRYYPEDNQYILTEVGKTDSDGKTLLHIVLEDVFYTIIVEDDGEILYSGDPSKKYCSDTPCTQIINTADEITDIWSAIDGITDFYYNVTYNDTTSKVRMEYTDTSGSLSYARMLVRLPDFISDATTICDVNSSSASGVLFCNLTETFMENVTGTFFVDVFVSRSPPEEDGESVALSFTKFLTNNPEGIFDTFDVGTIGSEGLVWGIFIIIALVSLGIFNPKLAIVFTCIAIALVGFLGIVKMSFSAIMGIVGLGAAAIYFMTRGEK